jgi:uncharacterized protein
MNEQYEYLNADTIKHLLANLKQLTFEVTDACNLRCKYCGYGEFYGDYDKREDKMISIKAALKLIDYLVDYWNSNRNVSVNRNVFVSFYGGEPLLNMTFIITIIDYIEKLDCPHRNFTFSMTTNAILLSRYMDYLVEHQVHLLISLDGNEYNTSYRVDKSGHPAFPKIIKNVDALREKYPDYFEQKVNFNAVLHNRNSVEEIVRFIKDKYDKVPSIGELNNMGVLPEMAKTFTHAYRNINESLYQSENYEEVEQELFLSSSNYQSLTRFIHQYSGFVYRDYTDLLFDASKKRIPTGTCLPFGKKMFVTVNGKLLPCERIGHQFALGKVSEAGVNLDLQEIADKYNGYYAKVEKHCKCGKCHNAKACIQCVFNLNDLDNNPICYGFMNKQAYDNYVADQMNFLRKHPEDYYRIMEEVIVE